MSSTIFQSWLRFMSIESVILSNHLIFCHRFSFALQSFPAFSNEPALHVRWPMHWSFSFSTSSFNEYSGLISFRTDWFDLLVLQGTLKSLLQHYNLKESVLQCSVSFMVQSTSVHDYWKNHCFDYTVSLVAQLVKNSPAKRETWVLSLGWEDPLEKGKATRSSILAWRIP